MVSNRSKVIISTGLAMFSMFFGAGNVVFPLDLGRVAGSMNFYAILGLLISAVVIPFTGVIAMFLFEGDYQTFFNRIGKVPGFAVITFFNVYYWSFCCYSKMYRVVLFYLKALFSRFTISFF